MQLGATLIFLFSLFGVWEFWETLGFYMRKKNLRMLFLRFSHTKKHNKTELQYITVIKVQVGV